MVMQNIFALSIFFIKKTPTMNMEKDEMIAYV